MINTDKLRGIMAEKRVTGMALAEKLGVADKTFYRKMQEGVFRSDEIEKMIDILDIEDPCAIFFTRNVSSQVTEPNDSEDT